MKKFPKAQKYFNSFVLYTERNLCENDLKVF